ncbi:MAG: 3-hydroxyacyl-CoA dehydrogenase [Acidimicrobiaceae bacterium]|nr:3-hydroxyacyl-CoA dehydrogenase [Acidimicrobiaceae bacterium]|tara:strand:- start:9457 stop:10227 length:771 start_codon:yes stop_codon:yes gene_type:complete
MKVEGSVALVTGGASGLGAGVAQSVLERGGRVAILDQNLDGTKGLLERFADSTTCHQCDVTDPAQVENAVRTAVQEHGRLDLLVSCAGISFGKRVISREGDPHPLDHFKKHIDINLVGLFDVLRHAVVAMARNEPSSDGERGLVVNLASIAAFEGQVGQASYGASKAGVVGLTSPLARDLAVHGIRVMTVCPGTMDTPMLETLDQSAIDSIVSGNVFPKRLGRPEDLGNLVVHMMENSFLNGEVVRLDAGLRLGPG